MPTTRRSLSRADMEPREEGPTAEEATMQSRPRCATIRAAPSLSRRIVSRRLPSCLEWLAALEAREAVLREETARLAGAVQRAEKAAAEALEASPGTCAPSYPKFLSSPQRTACSSPPF